MGQRFRMDVFIPKEIDFVSVITGFPTYWEQSNFKFATVISTKEI